MACLSAFEKVGRDGEGKDGSSSGSRATGCRHRFEHELLLVQRVYSAVIDSLLMWLGVRALVK